MYSWAKDLALSKFLARMAFGISPFRQADRHIIPSEYLLRWSLSVLGL